MSRAKNRHEAERWLLTAEEDLRAARFLLEAGSYAQACFLAQQSGKKAVKALWYLEDADPWGHSVQRLILEFPRRDALPHVEAWTEQGALLDKYYIPTRYPNVLPDLTPGQVYRREDAVRGIEAAQFLVSSCQEWLARA